jgi:hypothetical protein
MRCRPTPTEKRKNPPPAGTLQLSPPQNSGLKSPPGEREHGTRPRSVFDEAARCSQIVFASLDDETLLRRAQKGLIERYQGIGAREVIV